MLAEWQHFVDIFTTNEKKHKQYLIVYYKHTSYGYETNCDTKNNFRKCISFGFTLLGLNKKLLVLFNLTE